MDSIRALADRVVGAHVPGRGLHLVGATIDARPGAINDLITLGRVLSERGRAIIVDLNASPIKLAALASPGEDRGEAVQGLAGLSELLCGGSPFSDVIHRDHASRLHFIPAGQREADYRDFDLILDALSETYDFIVLLAPPIPGSDIAKVMAPYADFVVLAGVDEPGSREVAGLEGEFVEAGAREVLVLGRALRTFGRRVTDFA
jgi:Mrp family chromosome partitioning ATPase